jgi:hypothetical protein
MSMNDDRDEGDGPDESGETAGDPRVQDGLDHLQRAAREMIAASRALLDVAEELVEDPHTVGAVVGAVGSFAKMATRAARPGRRAPHADDDPDDDDDPGVQRIPIS